MGDLVPEEKGGALQSLSAPLEGLQRLVRVGGRSTHTLVALAIVVCIGGVLTIAFCFFRADGDGPKLAVFAMVFILAAGVVSGVLGLLAQQLRQTRAETAPESPSAAPSPVASPSSDIDIFFAHQHDNWPVVVTLAQNLQRWGCRVFPWAGEPDDNSNQALLRARAGVILLTPEALQSAWAGHEYARMAAQMRERPFPIVTISWGRKSSLPNDDSLLEVHLGTGTSLQAGLSRLRQLLSEQGVLTGGSPRPPVVSLASAEPASAPHAVDPQLASEPSAATSLGGRAFVDSVFAQLRREAVLLLAQEDRLYGPVVHKLLRIAEHRFGAAHVQQLVPLFSVEASSHEYFSALGKQCGFEEPTPNAATFEAALYNKLSHDGPWLLLVNGVESSAQQGRDSLALVLRGVHQMIHQNVHILLLGGHRVVEMNYTGKGLSPLQFAVPREWPEMNVDDVHTLNEAAFGAGRPIPAEIAELILQVAGAHPRLVQFCVQHFHETGASERAPYFELLNHHPYLHALLSNIVAHKDLVGGFRRYAERADLGPAREFIDDPVVRLLYWKNLVRRSATPAGARFTWRCDAIRAVGQTSLTRARGGEASA